MSPSHPLNARQKAAFAAVRRRLPGIPASLANSSGIFLGDGYIHDLVRPGIALYGGNPIARPAQSDAAGRPSRRHGAADARNRRRRERRLWRHLAARRGTPRIAVLGAGYKDGVPRALSSRATDGPAQAFIAGRRCPVIGRVSMDMMAVDVTGCAAATCCRRGTRAELIGPNIAIDEAAEWAGTISYELLTRLGQRLRGYIRAANQHPPRHRHPVNFLANLGRVVLALLAETGRIAIFIKDALLQGLTPTIYVRQILEQMLPHRLQLAARRRPHRLLHRRRPGPADLSRLLALQCRKPGRLHRGARHHARARPGARPASWWRAASAPRSPPSSAPCASPSRSMRW